LEISRGLLGIRIRSTPRTCQVLVVQRRGGQERARGRGGGGVEAER
jgi:hypothetical protein